MGETRWCAVIKELIEIYLLDLIVASCNFELKLIVASCNWIICNCCELQLKWPRVAAKFGIVALRKITGCESNVHIKWAVACIL